MRSQALPLALALLALGTLCQCSSTSDEVVVSVRDQRMGVYSEGRLQRQYAISTSKFGVGDKPGTYRTPLGKHEIVAKIGHGLPTGAVLKSRRWNGEVLKPNAPGRDPIVSRILWLRGMESSNRNAYHRYIYIHGTTEENRLGTPASYGCIRMGMKDVVDLFNDLPIGAKVNVTTGGLPQAPTQKTKAAASEETEDPEESEIADAETGDEGEGEGEASEEGAVRAVPIAVTTASGENLPEAPAGADPAKPKKKRGVWPFRRTVEPEPAPETETEVTSEAQIDPADLDATPRPD